AIVTGSMKYTGDLKVPGMRYACCFTQPYHTRLTRISSLDATDALQVPGIEWAGAAGGRVVVVGQRYTQVQKALGRLRTLWSAPNRPKALPLEDARNGELTEVKEQAGDVDAALASSHMVISETYKTQYIAHAPIETDTAVAHPPDDDGKITIYTHSQNPFLARKMVSDFMKLSPEQVCIVTIPAGGAFGGKNGNAISREAAAAANAANVPVKMVYSRKNQFQLVSMFKPAAILDLTTGVNADGKIVARKLDFYQDVADGSRRTYDIPNVLTRAYRVGDWPFGSAATRGTSFVQTCFAIESHMHMIARKLDMDPLEFRRKNVKFPAFVQLIDACAGMLDYDNFQLEEDEGMGFGITNHGNDQLGVVGARVHVNRADGKVTVRHICAAFDIGTIINHRTCTVGIRGGITWGIGFALSEAIKLDGHRSYTTHLSQYGIPRFSDIPQIDVSYHDNHKPGAPRGCGELPVIPTIGAIVNAVYEATGLRFYQTPITPERILSGL
ncbi:MAG: molybdopterin-dependent oxidoreductase, partial [bacterium]|nr:molybdopterin-dependent oxidoreductase [bacterium]